MGGCRCFFRNCKVNTYKNPGMHFFRFPLNDEKRCALWVEYSRQFNLYTLPQGRRKNMVICSRHFRDECFMNYLKSRLVATAVPSIHRLSKDKALDYELDMENGVLVTLPEPTGSHLIPPPDFECPLGFNFDNEVSRLLKDLENERATDRTTHIDDDEVHTSSPSNVQIISVVESYDELPSSVGRSMEAVEIAPDQVPTKRTVSTFLADESAAEVSAPSKRKRGLNATECAITITEEPVLSTDNYEFSCQPTIINHQILDPEARIWLKSDSYNIEEDDDPNYEFVQVSTQSAGKETEQALEIIESSQGSVQEEDECFSDNVHIAVQLESTSAEIESLRDKLKEEIEKSTELEKKLSDSQMAHTRCEKHMESLKNDIAVLRNENKALKAKPMEIEMLKVQLEGETEKREELGSQLSASRKECGRMERHISDLKAQLSKCKNENDQLKANLKNTQMPSETEITLKQKLEEIQSDQEKQSQIEQQLQKQIATLEQSLDLVRQQLSEAKSSLNIVRTDYAKAQSEKMNAIKQQVETEQKLQTLQELYDTTNLNYTMLEKKYDILQKTNAKLNADYRMLESQQNQVSTITTSNSNNVPLQIVPQQPAVGPLTKAQLFNGIKRYISSSMCSLLRMEMFGSSEREWKSDERQVAVDLLRLGESVYKYLTDEWRFRLPALRDVRNWLSQTVNLDDEDDL